MQTDIGVVRGASTGTMTLFVFEIRSGIEGVSDTTNANIDLQKQKEDLTNLR